MSLYQLPHNLPAPVDDDGCAHLEGMAVPSLELESTLGPVDLAELATGRAVLYVYPRTGRPGQVISDSWNAIPGARGCTPQSCGFRDLYAELQALGVAAVYGLSTQDTPYQREAAARLHLPFPLLSDERFALTRAMQLPTFPVGSMTLLKRLTLILRDGVVEHVFYPVFPPDRNAGEVVRWLRSSGS